MWKRGAAYWRYVETINAIVAEQGKLKRLLARAWDAAYQWREYQPVAHRIAWPRPIVPAVFTVAFA